MQTCVGLWFYLCLHEAQCIARSRSLRLSITARALFTFDRVQAERLNCRRKRASERQRKSEIQMPVYIATNFVFMSVSKHFNCLNNRVHTLIRSVLKSTLLSAPTLNQINASTNQMTTRTLFTTFCRSFVLHVSLRFFFFFVFSVARAHTHAFCSVAKQIRSGRQKSTVSRFFQFFCATRIFFIGE